MQKSAGKVIRRQIFNKFRLFNFSEMFTILLWSIKNFNSAKKSKTYLPKQKFQKNHFTIEIALVKPIFGRKFNFNEHIWEQNIKTAKGKLLLITYGQSEQNIFI